MRVGLCSARSDALLWLILNSVLLVKVFFLGPTTLPTILPITDQEGETVVVDFHAWLEANAQITIIHAIDILVRKQQAQVAGDGKKKVIIERR